MKRFLYKSGVCTKTETYVLAHIIRIEETEKKRATCSSILKYKPKWKKQLISLESKYLIKISGIDREITLLADKYYDDINDNKLEVYFENNNNIV